MNNIVINDLQYDEELDRQALAAVMGGKSIWGRIKSAARRAGRFVVRNPRRVVRGARSIWTKIRPWF